MNKYFLAAGILCFILGIVHSILGEKLIFNHKRKRGHLVPTITNTDLRERHLRIIWASWHLVSFFGWCIGAVIINISFGQSELNTNLIKPMIYTTFFSSILVIIGPRGKHPGWVVLLIIAILLILGNTV